MKKEFLEKSILGSMIQENYLITESQLMPEMFMGRHHRQIFKMMQQLLAEGQVVDYITLHTRFEEVQHLGISYVTELLQFADPDKFDHYASMLRDVWREQKKQQILFHATNGNWDISKILHHLDEIQLNGEFTDASITKPLADMHNRPFEDVSMPGLITPHIADLTKLIDGFRPGELTILAARPSMGKTDVMNNFALYAGWSGHLPIVFSLEMSKTTLLDRLIATTGKYSRLKMRDPKKYFTEEQKFGWLDVLEQVNRSGMYVDDRSSLTLAQIRSQARRIIRKHPDKHPIIFIDYLQIIQTTQDYELSNSAISQLSRGLKQMAKDLNCPVVCLSQLNRNVEARGVKRPVMSDLRDSGSIEQDADVIILLYRSSYYEESDAAKDDILEMIVAKNRNGPTGTAYANYFKKSGHVVTRRVQNGAHQNA